MSVTLTLQPDSTTAKDANLYQEEPDTFYPTPSSMSIGEDNTFTQLFRAVFQYDLSSIPAGSTILTATFTLTYAEAGNWRSSNNRVVSVYRIIRAWILAEVTWYEVDLLTNWGTPGCGNTTTDREAAAIGTATCATTDADESEKSWTLTPSKVQEWITGGALTNKGFLMQCATESSDRYQFHGSASATASKRPKLVITYNPPSGFFAFL